MKILVYGAGVLGSLYAARLAESGQDVTLLARGERLHEIRDHGLVMADTATGQIKMVRINTLESLSPEDGYDLVMVCVRRNQLGDILPVLAANKNTPNVLFMVNNAAGPGEMIEAIGHERVILGFPGAAGTRGKLIVRYTLLPGWLQPTTVGELNGKRTPRLDAIQSAFCKAGFVTRRSHGIDAWLKTHAAIVSPLANAIYLAGGDTQRLARTRDGLILTVRAIQENLQVLQSLGIPILPRLFNLLLIMPEPMIAWALGKIFTMRRMDLIVARHANSARDEMSELADELRSLALQAGIATPAAEQLASFIDLQQTPLAAGTRTLPMRWRGTAAMGLGLTAGLVALVWLFRRRP